MPNPLNNLVDTAGDAVRKILAYHGSPHHFDKFDASKIGSGEGAQAYGQGLYFAGAEPTAKWYRDKLSDTVYDHIFDGKVIGTSERAANHNLFGWTSTGNVGKDLPEPEHVFPLDTERGLLQRLMRDSSSYSEPITRSAEDLITRAYSIDPKLTSHDIAEQYKRAATMAQNWLDSKRLSSASRNSGSMYEVEIGHSPESLLDWDSPLSSKPGVEAIAALDKNLGTSLTKREIAQIKDGSWRNDIYNFPQREAVDSIRRWSKLKSGAEVLKDAGVPGIKYLDGNSRGPGPSDLTRNYVMFPGTEDSISILRKYGLLPAVGVGAAAMSQSGGE